MNVYDLLDMELRQDPENGAWFALPDGMSFDDAKVELLLSGGTVNKHGSVEYKGIPFLLMETQVHASDRYLLKIDLLRQLLTRRAVPAGNPVSGI